MRSVLWFGSHMSLDSSSPLCKGILGVPWLRWSSRRVPRLWPDYIDRTNYHRHLLVCIFAERSDAGVLTLFTDIYVPASNRKLPPPLVIPRSSNGMNKSLHPSLGPSSSRGGLPSSRLRIDSALLSGQDEDDLPLGVVMVHQRQKEEAEERKRRALMERLERERRAREEEERKKQYAEQVAAARARRETERMGKPGGSKDAWLEGDSNALPPPPKPYAQPTRSSSNPDLTSPSSSATLQVNRPFKERRMTSESSVASTHSGTTVTSKRQDVARQQSAPVIPSPWSAMPSGPPSNSSRHNFSTMPRMPSTAPPTQMSYRIMGMPPIPDPLSLAMFEQGLLRPWAMDPMNGNNNGTLTPPRPPFSFGSSGDSSGSLTPPRFPDSRPPSWGSSNEDIRTTMQRMSSGSGGGGSSVPVPRPISGASGAHSSGGSAEDWRRSRSSMLISPADDQRSRSQSRSPIEPPAVAGNTGSVGHSWLNGGMVRGMRSETSMASHQQPQSQHRQRPYASSAGSHLQSQESRSQSRPRTNPPSALSTSASATGSSKGAYGLPAIESYSASGSLGRKSMLSTSRSTEAVPALPISGSSGSVSKTPGEQSGRGQERPRMHVHSKSSGLPASQRKSRLW